MNSGTLRYLQIIRKSNLRNSTLQCRPHTLSYTENLPPGLRSTRSKSPKTNTRTPFPQPPTRINPRPLLSHFSATFPTTFLTTTTKGNRKSRDSRKRQSPRTQLSLISKESTNTLKSREVNRRTTRPSHRLIPTHLREQREIAPFIPKPHSHIRVPPRLANHSLIPPLSWVPGLDAIAIASDAPQNVCRDLGGHAIDVEVKRPVVFESFVMLGTDL